MDQPAQIALLGLDFQQLADLVQSLNQPAYRTRQLADAIYRQRINSLDEVTTLPKALRTQLTEQGWVAGLPAIEHRFVSVDGTVRYLMGFADGESVETVWMPEGDGGEAGDGRDEGATFERATICVSSQCGCAVGCRFCLTAQLGLRRNLTAGEIAGQVLAVLRDQQVDLTTRRVNLVFMGQGEPFLNYQSFMQAVRLLVNEAGLAESRMTVSTSGILPRFADFANESLRPRLAISLNGSNNAERGQVMPINEKWPIEKLLAALKAFPLRPRERLTFEYVLLAGINDSERNARELARLLRPFECKINLIAWNAGPELPFASPIPAQVEAFQKLLISLGRPTYIRKPRGRDIFAACGQLKKTVEIEAAPSAPES
jgi:23S rRNA (adenine2503-C2)-methyltransferase